MNRKSFLASLAALVAAPFFKKKEATEVWIVPFDPNWEESVRKAYTANRIGKTEYRIQALGLPMKDRDCQPLPVIRYEA